ncbi:hypothetical protein RISK_002590 [Rhodopirellula islandica]|uniref:Uncharacterized protein n=1 Tax=Rhodopirellula islandica TaxID=595434 RepID=A0A0J1BFR1_RHOIS|nr:hypothetical protein RISK_002590 [Rhodopirellula islandica]
MTGSSGDLFPPERSGWETQISSRVSAKQLFSCCFRAKTVKSMPVFEPVRG